MYGPTKQAASLFLALWGLFSRRTQSPGQNRLGSLGFRSLVGPRFQRMSSKRGVGCCRYCADLSLVDWESVCRWGPLTSAQTGPRREICRLFR